MLAADALEHKVDGGGSPPESPRESPAAVAAGVGEEEATEKEGEATEAARVERKVIECEEAAERRGHCSLSVEEEVAETARVEQELLEKEEAEERRQALLVILLFVLLLVTLHTFI